MKEIDWEQRRYEIARECLASLLVVTDLENSKTERISKYAIECADALIEELKKKRYDTDND